MRLTFRELQIVARALDDFGWTLTNSTWNTNDPEEWHHLDVIQTIQRSAETKITQALIRHLETMPRQRRRRQWLDVIPRP